jgi:hypothetical protein
MLRWIQCTDEVLDCLLASTARAAVAAAAAAAAAVTAAFECSKCSSLLLQKQTRKNEIRQGFVLM